MRAAKSFFCLVIFISDVILSASGFSSTLRNHFSRSTRPFAREPNRMAAWDDADAESARRNSIRMDVRNFLTQRAIQSFLCLLDSCRDPHTVRWLEVGKILVICSDNIFDDSDLWNACLIRKHMVFRIFLNTMEVEPLTLTCSQSGTLSFLI